MNIKMEELKEKYREIFPEINGGKDRTIQKKFNSYLNCVHREHAIMKDIVYSCTDENISLFLFTSNKELNLNNFLLFILKKYINLQMEIINKNETQLLLNISDPEELIGMNLKWYLKWLKYYNIKNYQGEQENEIYFTRFLLIYYKTIQTKILEKKYKFERDKIRKKNFNK